MKLIYLLLLFSVLVLFVIGCGEDAERNNPLDARNEKTGGAPPDVTARAGDSQVILSWANLGIEGVEEYKIYRAHRTIDPDQFQFIASVPAKPRDEVQKYTYTDTGLQNDGDNVYFYRLSYVDIEGNETPDPASPQNLSEDWFLVELIPSEAPPIPEVQVLEDVDLQVRLIWEGYAQTAPADLAGFKVYSALKAEAGQEQAPLTLVEQIDDPGVEFYLDGNDYVNSIINFPRDGITKLYKVIAFDNFGVESDSPILEGTSPNLPPSMPRGITEERTAAYNLGWDWYEVTITWQESPEPDVAGYAVYAELSSGEWEFRKLIKGLNNTEVVLSDRSPGFGDFGEVIGYHVTSYDNTPKPDGKRDQSMQPPEPSGPIGPVTPGEMPPDFTLPELDGGLISLHDLKGKVVLIDFWATWCGPCVQEIPHLQNLYEKYEASGLVILGIDIQESVEVVRNFRDIYGLTYDILLDTDASVTSLYGVMAIPSVWIIDRQGFITWENIGFGPGGEVELEQQILAALQ